MNYIVFDLEWNQSSTGRIIENKNGALPFEIIEIGAVKTDESFNIISSFDRIIKPKVYLKLHKAVEKLVPLKQRDLLKGKPFDEALKEFLEWCGDDYRFCTWGDSDLIQLQRNMRYFGIENKFEMPLVYYDIQRVYSDQFYHGNQCISLSDAVAELKLPKESAYHRAIYDSQYTAKVAQCLDIKYILSHGSIDTFRIPNQGQSALRIVSDSAEQVVTRGFISKEKTADDRDLRSSKCFLCGEPTQKVIRWFCDNGRNYYAVFDCDKHGLILGKFRIRQHDSGLYYAIRSKVLADKEDVDMVREKREKERERIRLKAEA